MDDNRYNTPSTTAKCAIQNVMCSAYIAKVGKNKMIVVANNIAEACDKLENNGFTEYEFEHASSFVALV
jgi:hypothetical protein